MSAWDRGINWHLERVTAPTEEPLELEFVRDLHLRVTNGTAEDAYISHLITAAREECERFTQRAIPLQSWALVLDRFPCREIVIPRPPLVEISAITYVDVDGAEQTLDDSGYRLIRPTGPTAKQAVLLPPIDETWPSTQSGHAEAVRIEFDCGYVIPGSPIELDVPADLQHGMLLMIGELYKQRSDSVIGIGTTINAAAQTARLKWWGYRVF